MEKSLIQGRRLHDFPASPFSSAEALPHNIGKSHGKEKSGIQYRQKPRKRINRMVSLRTESLCGESAASQSNISTFLSTFSAHASTCPIRLVKLRGIVDFQRPKRQYPECPRPLSTV